MRLKYFKLCRRMANKSNHVQHKVSCLIQKGNNVLSIGVNSTNTHPASTTRFRAKHAELDAVLGLDVEDLQGANAYIFRARRDGTLGCARPCPHCFELLKSVGIKKLYYSDYDGYKVERIN